MKCNLLQLNSEHGPYTNSMIQESLSKMNTSVMLHEWSDDEKMTFAWSLGKALWRRRHRGA